MTQLKNNPTLRAVKINMEQAAAARMRAQAEREKARLRCAIRNLFRPAPVAIAITGDMRVMYGGR